MTIFALRQLKGISTKVICFLHVKRELMFRVSIYGEEVLVCMQYLIVRTYVAFSRKRKLLSIYIYMGQERGNDKIVQLGGHVKCLKSHKSGVSDLIRSRPVIRGRGRREIQRGLQLLLERRK